MVKRGLAIAATVGAATSGAYAQQIGDEGTLRVESVFGRQQGGEFTITNFQGDFGLSNFKTFCIERNETVSPPGNYE